MNGQWSTGRRFLYTIGNDADRILFWARVPILLVAIGFGWFLFALCRRRWGAGVALCALFFWTFSPNILAHAQYVTTDIGASATLFLCSSRSFDSSKDPVGGMSRCWRLHWAPLSW